MEGLDGERGLSGDKPRAQPDTAATYITCSGFVSKLDPSPSAACRICSLTPYLRPMASLQIPFSSWYHLPKGIH